MSSTSALNSSWSCGRNSWSKPFSRAGRTFRMVGGARAASGGLCAVFFPDVILDDRLEFFGDARAFQRDGLAAIDVHRRDRYFVGARQADADVRVLRFARPVHHAAHHGDAHLLHARMALAPHRHLRAQIAFDLLRELLEIGAGGAPAARTGAHHRRKGAQAHRLQELLRHLHFARGAGPAPTSAARGRLPRGSGVSETLIVSPTPSCNSTAIAALEATMPFVPMPASV